MKPEMVAVPAVFLAVYLLVLAMGFLIRRGMTWLIAGYDAASRASRKLSINSSRVGPCELTPGTSSTQPIHQSPACCTTACRSRACLFAEKLVTSSQG